MSSWNGTELHKVTYTPSAAGQNPFFWGSSTGHLLLLFVSVSCPVQVDSDPRGRGQLPDPNSHHASAICCIAKILLAFRNPATSNRKGCFTKGLSLLFWGHPSPCPGPVFTLICLDRRMGAWTTHFVFVFDGRPQEHWLHVLFVWLQLNSCSLWNNPVSAGFISWLLLPNFSDQ